MDIVMMAITIISSILAIVFSFIAFRRNQKADDISETKEFTLLTADVHHIKTTLESHIANDDKKLDNIYNKINTNGERISKLEEIAKENYNRINMLATSALNKQ